MGEPLCFGQVGFACPQLGRPLGHLYLQLIPGLAEFGFGPNPLVDEGCALKCCRRVVGGQAQQKLVGLRGEAGATTGRGHHALGIDADRDDHPAAWLDAADIGNDLHAREPAALGEMMVQPFRERLPCVPPRDVD